MITSHFTTDSTGRYLLSTVSYKSLEPPLFIVVFFVKFLHGPQTLLKLPFAVIALLPTALRDDFLCYVSLRLIAKDLTKN